MNGFSFIKEGIIAQTTVAAVIRAYDQHAREIATMPKKARNHLTAYRDQKIAGIRKMRDEA